MRLDDYTRRKGVLAGGVRTPLGRMTPSAATAQAVLSPRADAQQADKQMPDLAAAFDAFDITDGATLSFHHHYRNGDRLINAVLDLAARRGLRGLTIAPSSLFAVHAPLAKHITIGMIRNIITDYAKGPLADAMMCGALRGPALLQSHGGRARALSSGLLRVDVAFVGAPLATVDAASTGRGGALPCGPLGYAMVDARYARRTVVCADEITPDPLPHTDIPATQVDAVVHFHSPGAVDGIASDTTLAAQTPQARKIGSLVAQVITAAGLIRDGISLQTGAGGYSLASVAMIGQAMAQTHVRGSFISGGITGAHVALQQAGLFARILDVQCFDLAAVASAMTNSDHIAMCTSQYASPLHPNPIVDALSVMVLGAVEIDHQFNINVSIGGDGRLMGGPGGHPDAAQGARLTIATTGLTAGGYAKIVPQVRMVTTPGCDVDILVSDHGIAVNPARPDLRTDLLRAGLPVVDIETLGQLAARAATLPRSAPANHPRILLENRMGGLMDWA